MIQVKVENQNAEVVLKPEGKVAIQDEIVQMIVSALMCFRQRIEQDGLDASAADKDAEIILNKAHSLYNNVKSKNASIPRPVGPVRTVPDPMANIMHQIDEMIKGNNPSGMTS